MHRAQPIASAVCDDKWRDKSYELHRQRLRAIKPAVDNRTPPVYPHLYQKLKKAQMEEERCRAIERDNQRLVRHMTEIMQRPHGTAPAFRAPSAPPAGRSLNQCRRRQELARITQENQALLKRLQTRPPVYNHLMWEQERERNEVLCERICRFPYRLNAPADALEEFEDGLAAYLTQARTATVAARPVQPGTLPPLTSTGRATTGDSPVTPATLTIPAPPPLAPIPVARASPTAPSVPSPSSSPRHSLDASRASASSSGAASLQAADDDPDAADPDG